jgi:predicted alpha/beta superfamily hydrolase
MTWNRLVGLATLLLSQAYASTSSLTVSVYYPESRIGSLSIYLRGDNCGLNWDSGMKMTKTATNTWRAELSCTSNIKVEMKALISDNVWMIGSNHHAAVGSGNAETAMYPWFYTYTGELAVTKRIYSPELNNYRDVIVYTPPSYYENTLKTYQNVLIMHDGQNLFNPATAFMGNAWMVQDTLNPMITEGKMDEVLVVGVYNTDNRTWEYTYSYDPSEGFGGDGDKYLDFLESTIVPWTEKTYRVNIQRESLGILGSSLGGLISCYAGWTRYNVYGKVGCMSSSFWWNDQDFQGDVLPSHDPNPKPDIYLDSGTSVGGEAQCALYSTQIENYMIGVGYVENVNVFLYLDQGASHSETYWGPRFYIPMQDLYPPSTV